MGIKEVINPAGEKKLILIVEDEIINREMLAAVLKDSYKLLKAENGAEAMRLITENMDTLSLIMLDLNLPDMSGLEILREVKEKDILNRVPVIVLTAEKEAEVESLDIGASDFIPKPYPRPEVIRARVRRTIELSEDRIIISQTERDQLTGLYSKDYFLSYVDKMDKRHKETVMDAIIVNVNHFHMINERYGRTYADEALVRIASNIIGAIDRNDAIACRKEADCFMIYSLHRTDYLDFLDKISEGVSGEGMTDSVIRLRMGVYPCVDKSIDAERRFDRAKMAADSVRSTFTRAVAIYDNELHKSEIFNEQLLIDFPAAIEAKQFKVHYQPKYDIRGSEPVLNSAEALIRWEHPEFGMISPAVFINLFEKNGLIQKLDHYVWRTAAEQIKDWKERLGISLPVSVNVSRIDLFDPNIVDDIESIVNDCGLEHNEFMLELTETAYTQDSDHIIETVEAFREKGFFIEMDDFGSGYSSLNMLSDLPLDALKLDMEFIRNAFRNGKNTKMLEIVIEIADTLAVPVIAEGVETAEQMLTLRSMGCDIAQGYYFSKPLPPDQFEEKLLRSKDLDEEDINLKEQRRRRRFNHDRHVYAAMHDPVTGIYNHSAFDVLLYDSDLAHSTLLLLRIENYEEIARDHGRKATDRLMTHISEELRYCFRASDFVCRISKDEFAVILTRVNSGQSELMEEKAHDLMTLLISGSEGLPAADIRYSIVYGDKGVDKGEILQDAEDTLHRL